MNCRHTRSIAAHLLGALDPSESLELERHYRTCPDCRDELVLLAPLPGLLHRASPGDTVPFPAREPKSARRSVGRRLAVTCVALALLVLTGMAGYLTGGHLPSTPEPATVSWSHTVGAVPGMSATADLTRELWGTQIRLRLGEPPPGKQCRLIVVTRDGAQQTAGSWSTGYYTDADITTSTSVSLADMTRLEILDTTNAVLARIMN